MTMDDAIARYAQQTAAAQARNEQQAAEASQAHEEALADADRVRDRAVRVAAAKRDKALAGHREARERAVATARDRFDVAARNTLGVPDGPVIVDRGTAAMELQDGRTVVATATYQGPSGWAVDGPDGRTFLGGDGRVAPRAALWHIAAVECRAGAA